MPKFISYGEVLEDYVPGDDGFIKLVGGAPLNLAAVVSKYFSETYLITCLGCDLDSKYVSKMIDECKIKDDFIKYDESKILCHTEVTVDKNTGEREFKFFKENASFLAIKDEKIDHNLIEDNDVFHFGTVALLDEKIIKEFDKTLNKITSKNIFITFDPNLRDTLFVGDEQIQLVNKYLKFVNLLKVGSEELSRITNNIDLTYSTVKLFNEYPKLKGILVTFGKDGLRLFLRDGRFFNQEAIKPKIIYDTIGCGDASFGAFIGYLLKNTDKMNDQFLKINDEEFKLALLNSAKYGSKLCEQKGAIPVSDI